MAQGWRAQLLVTRDDHIRFLLVYMSSLGYHYGMPTGYLFWMVADFISECWKAWLMRLKTAARMSQGTKELVRLLAAL
jgi:hypothetical protein